MTRTMPSRPAWPDTTGTSAPRFDAHAAAVWLLGRHPQLLALAERATVATVDTDGPFVDLEELADQFVRFDRNLPNDGTALTGMSGSELVRLRLLAAFAYSGTRLTVAAVARLDDEGRELLADWCAAVQA